MNNRRSQVGGILFLLVAGLCLSTLLSNAQQTANSVPLDRGAVFKTHVPHVNANLWRAQSGSSTPSNGVGGNAKPGGGGGGTFTGTPYATVGATKNATSTVPAAEEHIAVDPTSPSNLVAAISDFSQRGGYNTTKFATSFDGGGTWAEHFVEYSGSLLLTGDGLSWEANSDPVVAIDRLGNVYLADLYFNGSNSAGGLYVGLGKLTSTNLGITAATTVGVAVQTSPTSTITEDKEWIAADNSGTSTDGNVYVTWTRFSGSLDSILFSRSTDHGAHWSSPLRISPSSQDGAVQGSQVAVGPGGQIYVVYEVFYVGNQRAHFFAKSTNGGSSFSTPVAITPLFGELKFNSTYRKNTFASLAVGPANGAIYVVYADQPKSGGVQIRFIYSTNGGSTFSSPLSINDSSTGQRLMPSVAADNAGINFSWFDTRNGAGSTAIYDIYATRSDNGSAFSTNQRVTFSGSINAGTASFIGDYGGEAASSGYAHPVWTSGGFNGGQLRTATLH